MKLCPKCKAELDDNARFCLRCMTSLEEKEQIQPPMRSIRRWPLVLLCFLLLGAVLLILLPGKDSAAAPVQETQSVTEASSAAVGQIAQTEGDVTFFFRPATKEDYPIAIILNNYYILVGVEGTPTDGTYRIPSFVGNDTSALVTAVASGVFADTNARCIDLGFNVRYVHDGAFCPTMTDLYFHGDVFIDPAALADFADTLTIHCPEYVENTKGDLWTDLAVQYRLQWQEELI